MEAGTLVLLRHGESEGNAREIFTGLIDVDLTSGGVAETRRAAARLVAAGLHPAVWVISPMLRALRTAQVLAEQLPPPEQLVVDGRLVERNYGALSGMSKTAVRQRWGAEQFRSWRRTLDGTPPPLEPERLQQMAEPLLGAPHLALTPTENLRQVIARVGDAWQHGIRPLLAAGQDVLVVAHGNSLRALCAVLDQLDPTEVEELNLPNAHPLVYHFDADWRPLPRGGSYLDPVSAAIAARVIASQGGT